MIDINELRRLAQAATPGPWQFWHGWVAANIDNDGGVVVAERPTPSGGKYQAKVDANFKFIAAANPATVIELLDRLEAAEKDIALKERIIDSLGSELNAVSNERDVLRDRLALESQENGALRDSVDRACEERDALRAKIERMEKQEPVDLNYIELMNSAQKIVESYVYYRRFIARTPLENDIAVWMADFVFAQLGAKGEEK